MAEPQPIFFKDSARRVQCKMKVNKLQFICIYISFYCIYLHISIKMPNIAINLI